MPIPVPSDIEAIDKLLRGLDWIYRDFIEDCTQNPNASTAGLDEDFCIRNITRTLSYANHASLVEGLIRKTYKTTVGFLNEKLPGSIAEDVEATIKAQNVGFKRTSEFRHTVSAHLSYVNPKTYSGEDSKSTQLSSLMALLAPPVFDEEGTEGIREIPAFSLKVTHNFLWNIHYPKWGEIFDGLIKKTNEYLSNADK